MMLQQTNDAADEAPLADLPALPYPKGPSPQPRSSPEVIDLSSPTEPHEARKGRITTSKKTHSHTKKSQRSEDEKRLTGDYSRPADAVSIPHPSSWFMDRTAATTSTMKSKPGSSNSYNPINTLHGLGSNPRHGRPKTYGKQTRGLRSSVGEVLGDGQRAYIEQQQSKQHAASVGGLGASRESALSLGRGSPTKRRKVHHVINLDDDDDIVREARLASPLHTLGTSHSAPLSAIPSRSHVGGGNDIIVMGDRWRPNSQSEFRAVDELTDPRRRKARKLDSDRRPGRQAQSPFGGGSLAGSVPTSAISSSMAHEAESRSSSARSPRRQVLGDFRQGDVLPAGSKSANPDAITSPYFPNARVNESTTARPITKRRLLVENQDLRHQYRPVPSRDDDINGSDSEDELALPSTKPTPRTPSGASPMAVKATDNGDKSANGSKDVRKGWALIYARTHGFRRTGPELWLRPGDPKEFYIFGKDSDGNFERLHTVFLSRVNKVLADDMGRIRLEGGRRSEGPGIHTYDLEFENFSDFELFRDTYAVPGLGLPAYVPREPSWMQYIFERTLSGENKLRRSPVYDSTEETSTTRVKSASTVQKSPLSSLLKGTPEEGLQKPVINAQNPDSPNSMPATTRVLHRPIRSTRANNPLFDLDLPHDHQTVEKFSQTQGLGRSWDRPLNYSYGHQRAVVHFDDLPRLDEEEYMNDSLIDFYIIYLFKKLNVPMEKVFFWNTYFYTTLTSNTSRQSINYAAVSRWTSKIEIFAYDYIVVPINEQTHWYLAIICNVSNIARKPLIENFDDDQDLEMAVKTSLVNQVDQAADQQGFAIDPPQSTPQPARFLTKAEDIQQMHEAEVNLFDEDAQINVIDRDELGLKNHSELTDENVLSRKGTPIIEAQDTTASSLGLKSTMDGILSQSATSPQKKKKTKRKFMQPKRDPEEPVIIILDSLGGPRSSCVRALKEWVAAEGKAKRGMEAVIKQKGYYPKASQIPMQDNWTDCGVYLLGYAEKFFQNPDEFKNKLLMGEMSAEDDWPELKPSMMRKSMREIIMQAAKDQETARKEEKRAKKESIKAKSTLPVTATIPTPKAPTPLPSELAEAVPTTKQAHSAVEASRSSIEPPLAKPPPVDKSSPPLTPQTIRKVSDSPPIESPQIKLAATTLARAKTSRHKSPEVRIPINPTKPRLATPPRKIGMLQDSLLSGDATARGTSKGAAASQPIEILDSQEAPSAAQPSPSQATSRSPVWSKSSPMHTVRMSQNAPSVGEVASSTNVVFNNRDPHMIGHELEAELDEGDEEMDRNRRSKSPLTLKRAGDGISDPMEIDLYEEAEAMILDEPVGDSIVRETPEADRCSLDKDEGWVSGTALP